VCAVRRHARLPPSARAEVGQTVPRVTLEESLCPRAAAREWAGEGDTGGGRTPHVTATARAVELARIAAEAAAEKLAADIIAYDVSEQLVITDVFLLCSAANDRQVRAIVDQIEEKMRLAGARPVRREGERERRWVLLDYVDIVVHVQHAEERVYYALERLWKDCPRIPLPEPVGVGGAGSTGPGPAPGGGLP
jgi:ribosome-associated protein